MNKKNISIKGSSETTREAFCFNIYKFYLPQQKKKINPNFLVWFIGFTEGDGSFTTWFDNGKRRAGFTIDQKDPKVLHYIRSNLGFGKVSFFENTGYHRYSVYDDDGLLRLFCIFFENIVLDGPLESFEKWTKFLQFPEDFIISKENRELIQSTKINRNSKIDLNNPWLIGFWEADGGFSAKADWSRQNPNIVLKAYLTQDGEVEALQRIAMIFYGVPKNLSKITNNTSDKPYNRLEFSNLESITKFITYFGRFGFKGKTNITFRRWVRVYEARQRIREGFDSWTKKSIKKVKKLIKATKTRTE